MTIGMSNGQSYDNAFDLTVSQLPAVPSMPSKSLDELWNDLSQPLQEKFDPPEKHPPDLEHPYDLNAPRGSLEPAGPILAGDVVQFPSVMSNPNLGKTNPNATLNKAIGRDNVVPIIRK